MIILNKDRYSYVEKWMNCPHKKIVLNRGSQSCNLTEEGLKRYADIKGVSVDLLMTQLKIYKAWEDDYRVHHSEVQCDPDFVYLIENNPKEVVFRHRYYEPIIIDLNKYKSTDKFIVVYEQMGYEGMSTFEESLYEYNSYIDIKAKEDALYVELQKLKHSLKEVR